MSKIARIPVSTGQPGYPGLVRWIKRTHPAIYRELAARIAPDAQVQGLGFAMPSVDQQVATAAAKPSAWAQIGNTLRDIVSVALPAYQQQKIFDAQLKRAAAGQTMLDTATVADMSSMKVGLDPSTKNTLYLVAGGLGLLFIVPKLLGARRS